MCGFAKITVAMGIIFGIPHIWINAVYTEALCEYRFPILCGSGSSKVLIVERPLSDELNSHS